MAKLNFKDEKVTIEYGPGKAIKTRANAQFKLMQMKEEIMERNKNALMSLSLTKEEDGKVEITIPVLEIAEESDEEEC